jgi:hypothetical protein
VDFSTQRRLGEALAKARNAETVLLEVDDGEDDHCCQLGAALLL